MPCSSPSTLRKIINKIKQLYNESIHSLPLKEEPTNNNCCDPYGHCKLHTLFNFQTIIKPSASNVSNQLVPAELSTFNWSWIYQNRKLQTSPFSPPGGKKKKGGVYIEVWRLKEAAKKI